MHANAWILLNGSNAPNRWIEEDFQKSCHMLVFSHTNINCRIIISYHLYNSCHTLRTIYYFNVRNWINDVWMDPFRQTLDGCWWLMVAWFVYFFYFPFLSVFSIKSFRSFDFHWIKHIMAKFYECLALWSQFVYKSGNYNSVSSKKFEYIFFVRAQGKVL